MPKKPFLFAALLISALSLSSNTLANENNDPVEHGSQFAVGANSWQLLKKAEPELFLGVLGNAALKMDAEDIFQIVFIPTLNGQAIYMSNDERPKEGSRVMFGGSFAIIVIDKASLAQIDQPLARSIAAKMSSDDMAFIEEEDGKITINVLTARRTHYALLQSVSSNDKENPFSVAAMEKQLANLPHAGLDMVEVIGDMAAAKINEAAEKRSVNADVTEVYRAVRAALK